MISRKSVLLLSGLSLGLAAGAMSPAWAMPEMGWDSENAPTRLRSDFMPYFDESGKAVPMSAHVPKEKMPYDDTYWPSNRGGIAYRWSSTPWTNPYLIDMAMHHLKASPSQAERSKMDKSALEILGELERMLPAQKSDLIQSATSAFKYHSPSKQEALTMTPAQLAALSPTEKYDLFRGKYDYPMTRQVLGSTSVLRSYWEGICHGWAPASVNHAEPKAVDVRNADGIVIPFGSADVKALLDYMYTSHGSRVLRFLGLSSAPSGGVTQMGLRCYTDLTNNPNAGGARCQGVNAGSFHIAMTNYIGLWHVPFVADVAHGREIWNNPVYAYQFEVVDHSGPVAGSAPGTVRRVLLNTTVRYPSDDERLAPQWNPTVGNEEVLVPNSEAPLDTAPYVNAYRYEEGKYQYWLELGQRDQILGGSWVSQERPDYLWMMQKRSFTGEFEDLAKIYQPAY